MIARFVAGLALCLVSAGSAQASENTSELAALPPEQAVPMMVNLAALVDWSTQQPFIDRMKTARTWIGHLPGQWGGLDHDDLATRGILDDQGWPTTLPDDLGSIGTLIMTDLPEEAQTLAGRYILRFEGDGIVEVSGRSSNVRYGTNKVSFDFSPGQGGVDIRIQRTDRARTGDYVRNITIVREDRLAAYDAGEVFNPDFLDMLRGFTGLRYMDWMATNHSEMSAWAGRAMTDDYTYGWRGIPFEQIAHLSNTTQTDPWVTLPHKGTDAYFRNAATLLKGTIDDDLTIYVEYSNEVWNWIFSQAAWADEQALARWGVPHQWQQFYGMRAAQMARIWRTVFKDRPDRLITVLSTQAGWLGLEDQALNAPLWQAEDPDNAAPYTAFDAYAITGYMGGGLGSPERAQMVHGWIDESEAKARADGQDSGLSGGTLDAYVDANRYTQAFARAAAEVMDGELSGHADGSVTDLLLRIFPYHRDVADLHGLDLLMYEGGTHVVGHGASLDDAVLDQFFQAFNYSDEMAALYSHLLTGWARIADSPFNIYNDVRWASKWGSFGAMQYYGDDNPRWRMIRAFRDGSG